MLHWYVVFLQSKGIRWAMAGRNRAKLERVKQQLTQIDPACKVRGRCCCCCGFGRWAVLHVPLQQQL
jgi:hypothetical protein